MRNVTNQLFEGQGASIRKDLYLKFEEVYENAVFLVSSNDLPATRAQARDNFNRKVWQPIEARCCFSAFTTTHKSTEVFPYTTSMVAQALNLFTRYPHLVRDLEELDNEEVPEDVDDKWYKKQQSIQQKKFVGLLNYLKYANPAENANPLELDINEQTESEDEDSVMS